ncbi:MAG: DUF296 domain-containing protein [Deinococcus sp.]|nr:DUF296 domain-containing protein [Deinococcus sp.]
MNSPPPAPVGATGVLSRLGMHCRGGALELGYEEGSVRVLADGDRYLVRLDQGEEVVESLTTMIRGRGIGGGSISGIGMFSQVELLFQDPVTGQSQRRSLEGSLSAVSLLGNISYRGYLPEVTLAVVLADAEFDVRGGRLVSGEVLGSCELFVNSVVERVKRLPEERSGMPLLQV